MFGRRVGSAFSALESSPCSYLIGLGSLLLRFPFFFMSQVERSARFSILLPSMSAAITGSRLSDVTSCARILFPGIASWIAVAFDIARHRQFTCMHCGDAPWRSNQTLQPTPSRLVSSPFMIKILLEIAIRALARRG